MQIAGKQSGWRRRRVTRASAVALLTTVCIACTSSPPAPGDSSPPAESPGVERPTFDPSATPDPARVQELIGEGLGEGQAVFGALTHVAVEQISPLEYRIVQAYPTGNRGDMTVTLTPDQTFDPEGAGSFRSTYSETDGEFTFRLEFFVAYEDMPEDVEQEVRGAVARPRDVTFAAFRRTAAGPVAAETTGAGVVVAGVVTEAEKAGVSAFVEDLDRRLGTNGALDKFKGALEGGLAVKDAFAARTEHDDLMKRIDALEECAKNPTNPLTRRAYQEDPREKQRILDAIADTRLSITSNFAVAFVGMINSTASGLTGPASKVLAFVVGPVTEYVLSDLRADNLRRIAELEALVSDCDGFALELVGTNLVNPYLESTFDLIGEVIACPAEGGEWRFSGTYTLTNHADEIFEEESSNGWLLDMQGGQSPDSVELVLGWFPTADEQVSTGFPEGDGFVTITDRRRATATVYSAAGDLLGHYPMQVTPLERTCDQAAP